MVSNSPSPYCSPRSSAGIVAPGAPSIQQPRVSVMRHLEGAQHAARLGARLLELTLRDGIGHDAAAGTQRDVGSDHGQRADQDIEVRIAVEAEPAERAG